MDTVSSKRAMELNLSSLVATTDKTTSVEASLRALVIPMAKASVRATATDAPKVVMAAVPADTVPVTLASVRVLTRRLRATALVSLPSQTDTEADLATGSAPASVTPSARDLPVPNSTRAQTSALAVVAAMVVS